MAHRDAHEDYSLLDQQNASLAPTRTRLTLRERLMRRHSRTSEQLVQGTENHVQQQNPDSTRNAYDSPDRLRAMMSTDAVIPSGQAGGIEQQGHDRRLDRPIVARPQQTYALGTREDVQADDYQSPIANMFVRAYERYRTAEETRQVERAMSTTDQDYISPFGPYEPFEPSRPGPHSPFASQGRVRNRDRSTEPSLNGHHGIITGVSRMFHERPDHPIETQSGISTDQTVTSVSEELGGEPLVDEFDGTGPNRVDRQLRPTPLKEKDMRLDMSCKICTEQKRDTLIEPCMHFILCRWCAELRRQQARDDRSFRHDCPVCRKIVKGYRKIYLS